MQNMTSWIQYTVHSEAIEFRATIVLPTYKPMHDLSAEIMIIFSPESGYILVGEVGVL